MSRQKKSGRAPKTRASPKVPGKGQPSVYDAIAGRVTAQGFLPTHLNTSRYRDITSQSYQTIPPEKALFRLKGREYVGDNDPYWAEKNLNDDQVLPDSDLLKAIHTYAADFYSKVPADGPAVDYKSMDETALLAFGILMEEMADELLGTTGDLALTEGQIVVSEDDSDMSTADAVTRGDPTVPAEQEETVSAGTRKSKRRKTTHYPDDCDTDLVADTI